MDVSTRNRMEEIRRRIQNSTYEELIHTKIIEESRAIESGFNKLIIYYVPEEYLHDLKLTLNETIQLRKSRKEVEEKRKIVKDNEAIKLGSSNYPKGYNLANFEKKKETPEEREKRLKAEKHMREAKKRNEKRKIKNQPNNKRKMNKTKDKRGKKIKVLLTAIGLSATAIVGVAHMISEKQADTIEYNNTATTVAQLDESQISNKAETELKQKIADAIGVELEDVDFSVFNTDSSTTITEIRAGKDIFKRIEDKRGINDGNISGKISQIISGLKNAKDRKSVIRILNEVEHNEISLKNGKLTNERRNEGEER